LRCGFQIGNICLPCNLICTDRSQSLEVGTHYGIPYVYGGSLRGDLLLAGNGIRNDTKLPKRVALFGSATVDYNLDFSTTVPFYGVIDTPGGSLTLKNNVTLYGSVVAKNVTLSGTAPAVHYDLALRNTVFPGLQTPLTISDWHEVTNSGGS